MKTVFIDEDYDDVNHDNDELVKTIFNSRNNDLIEQ